MHASVVDKDQSEIPSFSQSDDIRHLKRLLSRIKRETGQLCYTTNKKLVTFSKILQARGPFCHPINSVKYYMYYLVPLALFNAFIYAESFLLCLSVPAILLYFHLYFVLLLINEPGIERVQALADISRSAWVVIATKPVHDCKSAQ